MDKVSSILRPVEGIDCGPFDWEWSISTEATRYLCACNLLHIVCVLELRQWRFSESTRVAQRGHRFESFPRPKQWHLVFWNRNSRNRPDFVVLASRAVLILAYLIYVCVPNRQADAPWHRLPDFSTLGIAARRTLSSSSKSGSRVPTMPFIALQRSEQ